MKFFAATFALAALATAGAQVSLHCDCRRNCRWRNLVHRSRTLRNSVRVRSRTRCYSDSKQPIGFWRHSLPILDHQQHERERLQSHCDGHDSSCHGFHRRRQPRRRPRGYRAGRSCRGFRSMRIIRWESFNLGFGACWTQAFWEPVICRCHLLDESTITFIARVTSLLHL